MGNMLKGLIVGMAAGAVLVLSIGASVAGLIIFVPYGIDFVKYLISIL